MPDGWRDHDVNLPVEFIGRYESHELDPCLRRQCSQPLLFLIAQAAGDQHPDPIGWQHGQRPHEIVDALLLGDPSDEAERHFRRADRPRVGRARRLGRGIADDGADWGLGKHAHIGVNGQDALADADHGIEPMRRPLAVVRQDPAARTGAFAGVALVEAGAARARQIVVMKRMQDRNSELGSDPPDRRGQAR